MKISYSDLSPAALRSIIDEFITREGTDYGEEYSLDDKASQILELLRQDKIMITFDPASETCSIVPSTLKAGER
jgi:uncharacterized protein YheU (UPF0270 family)